MTASNKSTGRASSITSGIVSGILLSMATTIAGAATSAKLIEIEAVSMEDSGYAAMIILLASSWIGATAAAGRIKRQRVFVCLASSVTYYLILLIGVALFFGGQYSGVGETGLVILCGSMLAILQGNQVKSRRKQRKTRLRYC